MTKLCSGMGKIPSLSKDCVLRRIVVLELEKQVCRTLEDLIKISKMSKAKMLFFVAATIAAVRSVTILGIPKICSNRQRVKYKKIILSIFYVHFCN